MSKSITTNVIWRFLERCGAQGVTLIVSIILARILEPEAYGTVSLVTIVISILQVFLDGGFSGALIQKKDVDDCDFSSVFFFNIIFGVALYLVLYFAAPIIANYYKSEALVSVLRVLGLSLIVYSLKSVQQAYVSRNMLFKKFFFATLGGTIVAAIVGIVLAYLGCGVWALVFQHLLNMAVDTVILWFMVDWKPKLIFSFSRLKGLLTYGWKLLVSGLIDTVYNDLRSMIIARKYTSEDLAFYNKGKQFPNLVVTNINSSIDSVLLPALSKEQDNCAQLKELVRKSVKTSTYLLFPVMSILATAAVPVVKIVLTEKWLFCVPYLRIFCFTYAFYPIHTANLNAIKALGRSDLFLKLEIAKKTIGIIAMLITMNISVMAMANSLLITTALSLLLNVLPNTKLLKYGLKEQIKDILPQVVLNITMGVVAYIVSYLSISEYIILLLQVMLSFTVYICGSRLLKIKVYFEIKTKAQMMIKKAGESKR